MSDVTTETNPLSALIFLGVIIAVGYFGYTTVFPSDRHQVRSCISSMMEAARGQVGYGELRDALLTLDAANTIEIVDETRRDFGDSILVTFTYEADGQPSRVMCGM